MKEQKDILGQAITSTGAETVRLLERWIGEGFLSGNSAPNTSGKNIFGRTVYEEQGTDLSLLAGLAVSGLRSSAFLLGRELTANQNQLSEAARQHLPAVIHFSNRGNKQSEAGKLTVLNALKSVSTSGCFQFVAAELQDVVDLALIARKVAERALIPGICAMDGTDVAWEESRVNIPTADQLRRFLGDPDRHIPAPTPSQEIVFGKDRRAVPHWFNLDTPLMSGMSKDSFSADLEGAAQHRFFNQHLPEIIEEVVAEYGQTCGHSVSLIQSSRIEKADYLILTAGSVFPKIKEAVEQIRAQEKVKVGCLNLKLLYPFPEKQLTALLKGKKGVTVLEAFSGREQGDAALFREVKASAQILGKQSPKLFSALHSQSVSPETLKALVKNMTSKNEQLDRIFLGIDFTREKSPLPQHELLLQSIRRAYPGISSETIRTSKQNQEATSERVFKLPFSIQKYQDAGPSFTQLSRFYHHTACFYQSGMEMELVADPYQALPLAPAATAGFAPVADSREYLPAFEPMNCTGCGACFTSCPHSAIPPIAIELESLIRGGMNMAAPQGTPVTGLTPMVKNLAKMAGTVIKEQENSIRTVNDFLPSAFQQLAKQMKLSGERLEKAQQEVDILSGCLGDFPVATTESFFHQPELMEKGKGALFSLSIDPVSCTGCGLCVEVCEEEALVLKPSEKAFEEQLLQTQKVWEQLPDTSSDTIRRMVYEADYDPFAATLLSRNFYLSTTGGATQEEGAASKSILHLIAAVTESVIQTQVSEQLGQLRRLIDDLSANIHQHLSDALPHDDFQLLVEGMQASKLPLDAVIRNMQSEGQPKLIDTPALQRKIALLNDLKELAWDLGEGPTGGGRARYGISLVESPNLSWAEDYPYNPFTVPVIWHREGAAPEKLKGMMLGWRRHLIDNVRLLRRGELEVKDKYRPEVHDREIGHLSWDQLKVEEKQLLNPLFLVGDQQVFSQNNNNSLLDVLLLDMPIKIVVLDTAAETSTAALSRSNSALFAAMSLRHAQIFRGSLTNKQRLYEGLRDGIHSLKPALFHLFSPEEEVFVNETSNWKDLSSLALQTRAFTSFRFDPDVASGYLASDIRIDANPDAGKDWVRTDLNYLEDEEEKTMLYTWTYADWLYAQKAWKKHFRIPAAEEQILPMAEFLAMDAASRKGKIPVIYSINEEVQLEPYAADIRVVNATQNALRQWNSLREVAGALTPFPEKLQQQIEENVKAKYEQLMTELKSEYEEKLRSQEQNMMKEVKRKLSDKLMVLSRQGKLHRN